MVQARGRRDAVDSGRRPPQSTVGGPRRPPHRKHSVLAEHLGCDFLARGARAAGEYHRIGTRDWRTARECRDAAASRGIGTTASDSTVARSGEIRRLAPHGDTGRKPANVVQNDNDDEGSTAKPNPFESPAPPHEVTETASRGAAADRSAEPEVTAAPAPASVPVALVPAVQTPHTAPETAVFATATAHPVTRSAFGRFIKKVPLLRRVQRQNSGFTPPKPVREPLPVVPPEVRRAVTHAVPVEVKVYVNPAGKVEYAELLSEQTQANSELATLAVYAARKWEFAPAREGDRTVPSEVLVKFRFGNPEIHSP